MWWNEMLLRLVSSDAWSAFTSTAKFCGVFAPLEPPRDRRLANQVVDYPRQPRHCSNRWLAHARHRRPSSTESPCHPCCHGASCWPTSGWRGSSPRPSCQASRTPCHRSDRASRCFRARAGSRTSTCGPNNSRAFVRNLSSIVSFIESRPC